ncbi:hypothetical protein DVB69_16065 [Sporosarcina sp. BI001-red]|uniref:hypothetical protein n=1 Tax=Sporosarcina sp. BI001-red TaxID=2282866 RepID=UPI000E24AE6C|nr:hypothetical protein [Sporosarcina sp. BI001-red]REB05266.1 hypothetical protein DVB69_16065 [Sporosarcina sp. BI001-red]
MASYLLKLPLSLSVSLLLFTYTVYLVQLFTLGDAYMGWLLIGVLMSSALLFSCAHPRSWMSKRAVKNTLFIMNSLVVGSGTYLASDMDQMYSTILTIIGYLLLAGMFLGIYQTALATGLETNVKVLHVLNITIGIVLTLGTLYFLYILLLFSEDGNGAIWKLFVPLVIYGIIYFIQMKVLKAQRKRIVYTLAAIQFLIPVELILIWRAVAGGGGL